MVAYGPIGALCPQHHGAMRTDQALVLWDSRVVVLRKPTPQEVAAAEAEREAKIRQVPPEVITGQSAAELGELLEARELMGHLLKARLPGEKRSPAAELEPEEPPN